MATRVHQRHPLLLQQDEERIDALADILMEAAKTFIPYFSNVVKAVKVAGSVSTAVAPAGTGEMVDEFSLRASEQALGLAAGTLNRQYFLVDRKAAVSVLRRHGGIVFIVRMACGPNLNFYMWPGLEPDAEWSRTFGALYSLIDGGGYVGEYLIIEGEDKNVVPRLWKGSDAKPKVPKGQGKAAVSIRRYQAQQRRAGG
jgi:hypothetical protein